MPLRFAVREDAVDLLAEPGVKVLGAVACQRVQQFAPEPARCTDRHCRRVGLDRQMKGPRMRAGSNGLPAQGYRPCQIALSGLDRHRRDGDLMTVGPGPEAAIRPVRTKSHREPIIRLSSGRRLKTCLLRNSVRNSRGVIPNCLLKTLVKTAACENPLANATSRIDSSP